ncbi:MAG TPA: zf-TFIIB domain-containing protein [Polyangiaceae bacterium]|nr:zf-TFIIB domain-containing protein [Polyangiaceae bacterium]
MLAWAMAEEGLRCPRDGAALQTTEHEGVAVDLCPSCHGVWLDQGELQTIEEKQEKDYSKDLRYESDAEPPSFEEMGRRREQGPIDCPKCKTRMETREHGFASQVLIDACVDGCGVWLDEGELEALEKFFERNRDNETLPLHWRLWASVSSMFKKR